MRAMYNRVIAVAGALLAATAALAEPDTFFLGTGRDGALDVSARETVINRYAQVRSPLAPGDRTIQVGSAEGFAAGDLVMVLQTTGLVPLAQPGNSGPMDLTQDPVGRWELARLASAGKGELYLAERLIYSYAAEVTQVIRVPEHTTVHIRPGANITARAWDGATGGVIAFLASGTVTNEGAIDASGAGFRGGSYVQQARSGCTVSVWKSRGARRGEGVDSTDYGRGAAGRANVANGGGGGACQPSGGGGGGNGGPGGQGGQPLGGPRDVGGMGGARLIYSLLDHLMPGGGGGGGSGLGPQVAPASAGGHGGGVLFIRAAALVGKGALLARGEPGQGSGSEAAGGGGAGGSISVRVAGLLECSTIDASGGQGGRAERTLAAGGGGGGGRALYQAAQVKGCVAVAAAGYAGQDQEFTSGAQPTPATRSSFSGTLTHVEVALSFPGLATVLWPEPGMLVPSRTPTILGVAPVGSEVVVFLDGWQVGHTVAEAGFFELALRQPLEVGLHHVQVAAASQGLVGPKSALLPFAVAQNSSWEPPMDTMPLAAPVITAPTSGTNLRTRRPTISGTADAGSSVVVEIDGIAYPPVTASTPGGSWSFTPTSDLTETFHWVRARVGNPAEYSSQVYFFLDVTSPAVPTVTAPASGQIVNTGSPVISGRADAGSRVTVIVDDMPRTPAVVVVDDGSWTYTQPLSLVDGIYRVSARARDAAGNDSEVSAEQSFTVDTTPPDTTAVSTVASVTNATSVTITFSSIGSGVSFECSLNNDPYNSCTSPRAISSMTHGQSYTFLVRARDAAGNVDPTPASIRWTVDTQAPTPPVFVPATALLTNNARPTLQGTAEPGALVDIYFEGNNTPLAPQVVVNSGGNWEFTPSVAWPAGGRVVRARATDAAGNMSGLSAQRQITIDLAPPDTIITSAPPAQDDRTTATFEFSVNPPGPEAVSFECSLNSQAYAACTNRHSVSVGDGRHIFSVRARDQAGNVDETPAVHAWSVDSRALSLTINQAPPAASTPTNQNPAVFRFSSNKNSATLECRHYRVGVTNQPNWTSCSGGEYSANIPVNGDGRYRFEVQARFGGNTVPANHEWLLDRAAPAGPEITAPSPGPSWSGSRNFNVSGTVAIGTAESTPVTVRVLAGGVVLGSVHVDSMGNWDIPLSVLADGPYDITADATDAAGNRGPASSGRRINVDTRAPVTRVVCPPRYSNQAVVPFDFSVDPSTDEFGSVNYNCSLNGGAVAPCSPSISVTDEREYRLDVHAVDQAGNRDATPETCVWTHDRTPPSVSISSQSMPAPDSTIASDVAIFSFTSMESGSQFDCQWTQVPPALPTPAPNPNGYRDCTADSGRYPVVADQTSEVSSYVLWVRATDLAGNSSAVASWRWTVDRNIPDATVTCPRSPTNLTEFSFSFSSSKTVSYFECQLAPLTSNWTQCSSAKIYSNLADGDYTFRVQSVDTLGRRSPETNQTRCEIRVDTLAPLTVISAASELARTRWTQQRSADFQLQAPGEVGASFECALGDATFEPCLPTYAVRDLADGTYTLQVRAKDSAGNVDQSPEIFTWRVDNDPPTAPVVQSPAPETWSRTGRPEFSGTIDEGRSSILVKKGGQQLGSTEADEQGQWSLVLQTPLPEGENVLEFQAVDGAGNAGPPSSTLRILVDTVPPETRVDEKPEGRIRLPMATFRFSASEAVSAFECSHQGGAFEPCGEVFTLSNLPEGDHTLWVRAIDRAGNLDPTYETVRWRVYLGNDSQVIGGGIGCSAGGSGGGLLLLLGLLGLTLRAPRHGRRAPQPVARRTARP